MQASLHTGHSRLAVHSVVVWRLNAYGAGLARAVLSEVYKPQTAQSFAVDDYARTLYGLAQILGPDRRLV